MKAGTQKRISFYQKTLPTFKDKLAGAVMMLVVALTCLVVATYAWITLSTSPEAVGITTTVSANGSLEIALSDTDGEEPDDSAVGDSTAAGTDVAEANLTWGNLVNLSSGYGLDEIVLRPARTSQTILTRSSSPLQGVVYGSDGRVSAYDSDYAYTSWSEEDSAWLYYEDIRYGVRAISSVTTTLLGADSIFSDLCTEAELLNAAACEAYSAITTNEDYMDSLAGLIGVYVTATLNSDSDADVGEYIEEFYNMMVDFKGALEAAGEALAAVCNIRLFIDNGEDYTAYTWETLYSASTLTLSSQNILDYDAVQTWRSDYTQYVKDLAAIKTYVESYQSGGTVTWANIKTVVNRLVDIANVTIDGTKASSISISNATSFLSGTHEAVINNGGSTYNYLYDFEEITGENMYASGLEIEGEYEISSFYTMSFTVEANVYTSLYNSGTSTFYDFLEDVEASFTGEVSGSDYVAEDTYGLAIDLWVRTNASGTVLTLEGDLTEDSEGNITGTEGENRVWQENALLDSASTTQGSGSFYIFYIDESSTSVVEDAASALELFSNIRILFLDASNNILATAGLDTEEYYSYGGAYYLPIKILSGGTTYTDEEGNTQTGITTLVKNTATRITVLVYLDGTDLTNEQVLAAGEIQATLNIQFGSSESLETIGDTDLESATRTISAEADVTEFDWDDEDSDFTTNFTVTVDGEEPSTMTARLQRVISTTQGKRLSEIEFEYNEDSGTWKSSYTFTSPGTYVLRSVTVDGAEVTLDDPITIVVSGYDISYVSVADESIFTSDSSAKTTVTLKYDSTNMPSSVRAVFESEDGTYVSASLTYDSSSDTWSGSVKFTTSGTYTLKYITMDGEQTELAESVQKSVEVILGLTVKVSVVRQGDSETSYVYDDDGNIIYETDEDGNYVTDNDGNYVPMTVETTPSLTFILEGAETFDVSAVITDDQGNILSDFDSVELVYLKSGSAVKENGLYDTLTWDEDSSSFVGTFTLTKAGIYKFSYVLADGSSITKATSAPSITAQSPDPPYYIEGSTVFEDAEDDYIFAPDGDAAVTAQIAYSSSAESVVAVFALEGSSATYTSEGTLLLDEDDVGTWSFSVPKVSGTQDGTWSIVQYNVIGVYDEDSNYYGEDDPYVLEITDSPTVKVVQTVVVDFADSEDDYVYGYDEESDEVTGTFMEANTASFEITISDTEGEVLEYIEEVTLTITHTLGTEEEYGNYTSDDIDGTNVSGLEEFELTLTAGSSSSSSSSLLSRLASLMGFTTAYASGGDTVYTASQELRLAGEYTVELEFSVDGTQYSYSGTSDGCPEITIYSQSPDLTITGTTPTAGSSFDVNTGSSTNMYFAPFSNYYEDYYALLGIEADEGCYAAEYTSPKISLKLSDAGSAFTKAVFTITDTTDTYDNTFSFTTSSLTTTGYVGCIGSSGTYSGSNTRYSVSDTYDTITMTYDGMEFTVELAHSIQIKMSSTAKPQIYYVQNEDSDFTISNLPEDSIAEDGNSYKVTAPSVDETFVVYETEAGSVDDITPTTTTTTSTVYYSETTTSGCSSTTTYYPYTKTVTTYVYEDITTTVYANTYSVTSWLIEKAVWEDEDSSTVDDWTTVGTYKVGVSFTVSSYYQATPQFTVTSEETYSTSTQTATRTVITYTAQSSTTSKPSGTSVDEDDIVDSDTWTYEDD